MLVSLNSEENSLSIVEVENKKEDLIREKKETRERKTSTDTNSKGAASSDRSDIISFVLSQMRQLDSEDDSDSEGTKFILQQTKQAYPPKSSTMTTRKSSVKMNNLKKLKQIVEEKVKKKSDKLQRELEDIVRAESRHIGVKSLFIF